MGNQSEKLGDDVNETNFNGAVFTVWAAKAGTLAYSGGRVWKFAYTDHLDQTDWWNAHHNIQSIRLLRMYTFHSGKPISELWFFVSLGCLFSSNSFIKNNNKYVCSHSKALYSFSFVLYGIYNRLLCFLFNTALKIATSNSLVCIWRVACECDCESIILHYLFDFWE